MKKLLKQILHLIIDCIAKIWCAIFSQRMYSLTKYFYGYIYSYWMCNKLKNSVGGGIKIQPHCKLIGGQYISIGTTTINSHAVLTAWDNINGKTFTPSIEIGDYGRIGQYCHISAVNKIVIGNGLSIGRWVTINDNFI